MSHPFLSVTLPKPPLFKPNSDGLQVSQQEITHNIFMKIYIKGKKKENMKTRECIQCH